MTYGTLKPAIIRRARLHPAETNGDIAAALGAELNYVWRVLRLAKIPRKRGRKRNPQPKE